jgi:hypothetical protein
MKNSITKIDQLESVLSKKKKYVFIFNFKELNDEENVIWLDKINKNYVACGCGIGKIFTGISLVLILLYAFFVINIPNEKVTYEFSIYAFIFVVILSLIGKFIGKKIAYKELQNDISELKNKILENHSRVESKTFNFFS